VDAHSDGGPDSSPVVDFGLALKRAQHLLGQRIDQALRPLDLNLGLWAVLRETATHPGASASELARASRHTPQTLSGLLRRLEDRGLIERSEARGRVVDNRLTPAGHETLTVVTRNVEDVITAALAGFSPEDRAAFAQLTTRFAEALTHHHEPGIPSDPGPSGA
jgi:DNA-binding MarR family transcriptional regulator